MAIVINGSGTVTGISVGGLPDDIVDAGMMADNSIDSDAYVDASIDNAHLADDAVGVAELSATGTASSSTFLRGDNSWAAAGGGKILQVVTATDSTERSTTSTSFVTASNTLSCTITPSATSSKIFVIAGFGTDGTSAGACLTTLYRGSTNLGPANGLSQSFDRKSGNCLTILDSPSTTSATTYQVYIRSESGSVKMMRDGQSGSITVFEVGA